MKDSLTVVLMVWFCISLSSCGGGSAPEITAGVDGCVACGMVIDKVNEASGFFADDGFKTFDSPMCMLRFIDQGKSDGKPEPDRIYFADYRTSALTLLDSTFFLLTDHVPTVMHGRVITFSDQSAAIAQKTYDDEMIVDWLGFRTLRGKPDRRIKLQVSEEGFTPDVIVVSKDDVIDLTLQRSDYEDEYSFTIQGYESAGEFKHAAGKEKFSSRIRADKPGAGFAFKRQPDGTVLGTMKVEGSHTPEEDL